MNYKAHNASLHPDESKCCAFALGIHLPDILKKWHKMFNSDISAVRSMYESIWTVGMPMFSDLENRIQQTEVAGRTDGLHYGLSSEPDIWGFWNSLNEHQKSMPGNRAWLKHLLGDALIYASLDISAKFRQFLEDHKGEKSQKELLADAKRTLHLDWDKLNERLEKAYPEASLPDMVLLLNIVQYTTGEPVFVDWNVLKSTIDYLRSFNLLSASNQKVESIINEVMRKISEAK